MKVKHVFYHYRLTYFSARYNYYYNNKLSQNNFMWNYFLNYISCLWMLEVSFFYENYIFQSCSCFNFYQNETEIFIVNPGASINCIEKYFYYIFDLSQHTVLCSWHFSFNINFKMGQRFLMYDVHKCLLNCTF